PADRTTARDLPGERYGEGHLAAARCAAVGKGRVGHVDAVFAHARRIVDHRVLETLRRLCGGASVVEAATAAAARYRQRRGEQSCRRGLAENRHAWSLRFDQMSPEHDVAHLAQP